MEMKVLFGGAIFLGGWLWAYLFGRQLLFNFRLAYPLIKKMRSLQDELIAVGARRYTTVSTAVCIVVSGIIWALVIAFCPLYLLICFSAGALICVIMLVPRIRPGVRSMFDTFCGGYYRFVMDDELRTAMYKKKPGQIKVRLKAMGIEGSFVPDLK